MNPVHTLLASFINIYSNTIQKEQLRSVEYFNHLDSVIINDAICTRENKSRVAMAKAAFNKKTSFISKFDLNLRKKLDKFYISSVICVVLKLRHYGKYIRNIFKFFKCGAEDQLDRSFEK